MDRFVEEWRKAIEDAERVAETTEPRKDYCLEQSREDNGLTGLQEKVEGDESRTWAICLDLNTFLWAPPNAIKPSLVYRKGLAPSPVHPHHTPTS